MVVHGWPAAHSSPGMAVPAHHHSYSSAVQSERSVEAPGPQASYVVAFVRCQAENSSHYGSAPAHSASPSMAQQNMPQMRPSIHVQWPQQQHSWVESSQPQVQWQQAQRRDTHWQQAQPLLRPPTLAQWPQPQVQQLAQMQQPQAPYVNLQPPPMQQLPPMQQPLLMQQQSLMQQPPPMQQPLLMKQQQQPMQQLPLMQQQPQLQPPPSLHQMQPPSHVQYATLPAPAQWQQPQQMVWQPLQSAQHSQPQPVPELQPKPKPKRAASRKTSFAGKNWHYHIEPHGDGPIRVVRPTTTRTFRSTVIVPNRPYPPTSDRASAARIAASAAATSDQNAEPSSVEGHDPSAAASAAAVAMPQRAGLPAQLAGSSAATDFVPAQHTAFAMPTGALREHRVSSSTASPLRGGSCFSMGVYSEHDGTDALSTLADAADCERVARLSRLSRLSIASNPAAKLTDTPNLMPAVADGAIAEQQLQPAVANEACLSPSATPSPFNPGSAALQASSASLRRASSIDSIQQAFDVQAEQGALAPVTGLDRLVDACCSVKLESTSAARC